MMPTQPGAYRGFFGKWALPGEKFHPSIFLKNVAKARGLLPGGPSPDAP